MNDLMEMKNLMEILEEYASKVYTDYRHSLIEDDRFATKNLINSIKTIVKHNDRTYEVDLHLEDYWKYVEWDTKPHWPPKQPILNWIKAKPILPEERNGKLPTEDQLAFLIGRKISEQGTKGTHNLQRTLEEVNKEYLSKIEDAVLKDFEDSIETIIKVLAL